MIMTMTRRMTGRSYLLWRYDLVTAAVIFLFWSSVVNGSGVSVSPGKVEITGEVGKAKGEIIRVKNPSTDVSLFSIYPDEMEEEVRAIPSSFVLEGGAEREVMIEARPKRDGVLAGTLSVRAEALSKEVLGGAAGIKIPVRLEVTKASPYLASMALTLQKGGGWILLFVGLLVAAGICFGYGVKELKKT